MRNKVWIPAFAGMTKILALLLFLSGCASAGYKAQQTPPAGLAPGAVYSFEGNTVRYTDKDIIIEASYLTPSQADLYFSLYKEGKYKNPFPPGFFVFQLTVENKGRKNVTFSPGMAYLLPKKGRPETPEDYTGFYATLQLAGDEDSDERMDAYKASVLDTGKTIRPGDKAQGLIVFSPEKSVQESAVLVLNDIYIGNASRTVPLQFKGIFPAKTD